MDIAMHFIASRRNDYEMEFILTVLYQIYHLFVRGSFYVDAIAASEREAIELVAIVLLGRRG